MIKRIHSNLMFSHDLAATADFYEKAGFTIQASDDAVRIISGDFRLCFMDESKVQIESAAEAKPRGLGLFIYVEVDDVDAQYAMLQQNNIHSTPPKDWPWGRRECVVKDPDGYRIVFFASIKK